MFTHRLKFRKAYLIFEARQQMLFLEFLLMLESYIKKIKMRQLCKINVCCRSKKWQKKTWWEPWEKKSNTIINENSFIIWYRY